MPSSGHNSVSVSLHNAYSLLHNVNRYWNFCVCARALAPKFVCSVECMFDSLVILLRIDMFAYNGVS